ncbi:MAG: hypothetical protein ABI999_06755 [Acidobacteriota bacterium]
MQMPYDSLDDFASSITVPQKPKDPPPFQWLSLSGEIEVLKPLVSAEEFAAHAPTAIVETSAASRTGNWFSGHARTLALAGSFALVAGIVAAAVFIGTDRPNAEPARNGNDVSVDQRSEQTPALMENLAGPATGLSDPVTDPPSVSRLPRAIRSIIRPQPVASRVLRAFYRPKRSIPKPQIVNSGFVPTTLVIYVEKGAIKTRIEPQLSSSYKKPAPLQN